MVITREWIQEHATAPKGGWTRAQLKLLGVPWPPPHGWLTNLWWNEVEISDETALKFEAFGNERRMYLAKRRRLGK